jgi:hypothetical protein
LKKHEALQSAGTILLVWLGALGVIFLLPDMPTTQKYLLGSVASPLFVITRDDRRCHFLHGDNQHQNMVFVEARPTKEEAKA